MNTTDVMIVGAGPTGLTLACELIRRGISCRVIEQAAEPSAGSRGFSLKPRSLEILDQIGVAERIVEAAQIQPRIRFHLGTALLFDLQVPAAPTTAARPFPNTVALPQWRTEAILRERYAELGGKVEFGRRLSGFTADADGVTATVEQDLFTVEQDGELAEEVRVRYLIGADGGRSQVRRTLGVPFTGDTEEDTRALLADVRVTGLPDTEAVHLWMGGEGHILVARPTPHDDRWQVIASLEPDAAGQWPSASLETLQQAVADRTGRPEIQLSDPSWISVWRYNLRMAQRYRTGRVLLAGDAAHVHSPFGAYGMNTGIQDAANLGWKLALVLAGQAGEQLLDSYEAERLPVARAILADSDSRFAATTPPRALRPVLRFIIKPFLARQQRQDRTDHPVYRSGPLTQHLAGRTRVRAGDAAPDARLTVDGRPARLFDLLRDGRLTVLSFGGQVLDLDEHIQVVNIQAAGSATEGVADVAGDLRRQYGARKGSIVVLRPDGYVGLVATRPTGDTLRAYLRTVRSCA